MAQAVLYVELVPTTTGIKRNVEKELNGTFDVADKKGSSVFAKIGGLAKGAALAAGAAALTLTGIAVKGGFSRMLKIEDAQAKLEGLGHTTKTIETIMGSALASVKGTAFGLDDAASLAATAVAAGIKPGQELEKYLRLTADAATIAGGSLDELGSVMNNVTTVGAAYNDSLQILAQKGLPIYQWLAEEMGVSTAAVKELASQGQISAETFRAAIEKNIGGAALTAGDTTSGAFENMMAALSRVGVALLENVFPYFKDMFNGITGLLDATTERIGPFGDALAAMVSPVAAAAMATLSGAFSTLVGAFQSGGSAITGTGLDGFLQGIGNAAATLWAAIGPLIPQLLDLWMQFSPLALIMSALGPVIGEIATVIAGVLGGAITAVMPTIIALAELFGTLVADALPLLIPLITQLGEFVGELAAALLPLVGTILDALMPVFAALVPVIMSIIEAILPLVGILLDALMPIIAALVPVVALLFEAFAPLIQALVEVLVPIITTLADILAAVLVPIFGIVIAIIQVLAAVITWLVKNIIVPFFQGILIPVIRTLGGVFQTVFGFVGTFIAGIFSGIEDVFIGMINFIIDGINTFIGGLNEVGNFISDITGGSVDITVGKLPRLANGALVEATLGGSAAIIGEGRYDEAVVPLGGPQLEKIRDALNGGNGSGRGDRVPIHQHFAQTDPVLAERAAAREYARVMATK